MGAVAAAGLVLVVAVTVLAVSNVPVVVAPGPRGVLHLLSFSQGWACEVVVGGGGNSGEIYRN